MAAALTKGHEDKDTGMQGCPGIGIAYTTHQKWSEWETNRSAVLTGRCRRKRQGGGGSLKPSDLKMEKIGKKKCFLQNRPVITALRLVFHSDYF